MVIPVGPGMVVLNQTVLTEKLADNITAHTLLHNLLDYAGSYKLEQAATAACVDPALAGVLDGLNLQYTKADSPLAALEQTRVAIVSATPANLKTLVDNQSKLKAFTDAGGYLVLHGLAPEGLDDYNKLVGFDHMIRPFGREKVALSAPRHPLMAGVGVSDIALYSNQKIFNFQAGDFVANDTFSFVVDLDDVAPFAKPDNGFHHNLVCGMSGTDGWPYICNEPAAASVYTFTFPKPQTLVAWTWWGNTFYNTTSQVSLTVDNDSAGKLSFDVPEKSEPVTLDIKPPKTGTVFTIHHEKFTNLPDKKGTLGCDNISFFARRPADFHQKIRAMLNIGALVEYPQGKGGIVLCNLLFKPNESPAVNGVKKRAVLTAILANLKAPFASKTVVAGANLEFTPIDLSKQANQFRTDRGWFGDRRFTFNDLPIGEQRFAGVKYNVYEFATSPVPTVIMLGGPRIPNNLPDQVLGIPVNAKADALFFLQAARIDKPITPQSARPAPRWSWPGTSSTMPTAKPPKCPSFWSAGWTAIGRPIPSRCRSANRLVGQVQEFRRKSAVAYSMQWNNPHGDVEIKSVDLVYPKDHRGVPALIAITAARVP